MFFCSEIHATDSTLMGWSAKIVPASHAPLMASRDHVQHDVHEVVAEHGVAPEARLDPERAVQERIVLLRGAEFGPDAAQSVERAERGLRDVRVVVPDVVAEERGPVDGEGQAEEEQPSPGVGGAAGGAAGGAGR